MNGKADSTMSECERRDLEAQGEIGGKEASKEGSCIQDEKQ
jgi:hypothetical protein